jgi:hypothetical protein
MHLKYLIYSSRGELLAATGWSSSVWKLKARDRAIGPAQPRPNESIFGAGAGKDSAVRKNRP